MNRPGLAELIAHGRIVSGTDLDLGGYPTRERRPTTRRPPRQLANGRTEPEVVQGVDSTTLRELRDDAMVALLLGCGLRRGEALRFALESIQQREEHWAIADLVGKGGHIRTVPIPAWVKSAVDGLDASHRPDARRVFRAINKGGPSLG
jgi:integrase